ncbi:pentapeptide repeat-containing protein [Calothrix sp. 336/3]|uniref:pentapeptide repeat-containing protein n=1 Tax=Calothrix sp. 336/3 TaxID=1337936 RepID=UPI0004E3ECD9|nr:pentapeptide repeat-containing protein [Calothrix sp. 336/3]AKG21881.1 hypothetical protein IJ00_11965 [Calothrix sp. 336/3]
MSSHNFSHQNLSHRSFQGQNLDEADFSYADIRGCNFNYASLRGANFEGAKIGQTIWDLLLALLVAIAILISAFHAISQMVFGVINRTPSDPVWNFAIVLVISLLLSGIILPIGEIYLRQNSILNRIIFSISASASGALMGFYYGGIATGERNPQLAVLTAVVLAIVMGGVSFYLIRGIFPIMINTIAAVSGYGLTFLLSAQVGIYLSSNNLVTGIIYVILFILSFKYTFTSLNLLISKIFTYKTTSFCGADLTNTELPVKSV